MRSVARLLFGPDGDRLLDMIAPDTRNERGMADRAREAGEWCQTTPGAGSPARWVTPPDRRPRPKRRG